MAIERIFEGGLLVRERHFGDVPPASHAEAEPRASAATPGALLKASDYDGAALGLVKSLDEYRVTLGVAYPAYKVDERLAKDGFQDFAPADLVEQIAWRWMKERQAIGLFHERGTEGHGITVESGIHRGPDWLVKNAQGEVRVCEGDWLLAVEWDKPTWALIKSRRPGAPRGWSPQGRAERDVPSPESMARVGERYARS